jgi:hypothetical protein
MDDYFGYFCYLELIILVLCLVSSFFIVEGILVIIDILCVFLVFLGCTFDIFLFVPFFYHFDGFNCTVVIFLF